jgi:PAS domain S-box-containing protein
MSTDSHERESQAELRARAVTRLTGSGLPPSGRLDSSAAFQALYELALSPSTAPRALALLHELQVHQVELELQDEELRRSRSELEVALIRQAQLYDYAPVGLFTVDRAAVLCELNLAGAHMLGFERDALVGRPLDNFLTGDGALELHAMLSHLSSGAAAEFRALQLNVPDGGPRGVHASASRDPAGTNFLVALLDVGAKGTRLAT